MGELPGWWVGQRPALPPLRPLGPPAGRPACGHRGCRTTSAGGGAGLSRAPGAGRSARGPRQAGIRGSRAQLTTKQPTARGDGDWREPPAARPAPGGVGLPGCTVRPATIPGAAPGGRGTVCVWWRGERQPRSPPSDQLRALALITCTQRDRTGFLPVPELQACDPALTSRVKRQPPDGTVGQARAYRERHLTAKLGRLSRSPMQCPAPWV